MSWNLTTAEATMTIERASQTLSDAPSIANRTTTTIAVNPVPGAEYSIDGGRTWQDSPQVHRTHRGDGLHGDATPGRDRQL